MLALRPGVQVRSSGQELSGGQRTGHRLLRLAQGKKGEAVSGEIWRSDLRQPDRPDEHIRSDKQFEGICGVINWK